MNSITKRLHRLLGLQIILLLSVSRLTAQSGPEKGFGTDLPSGVKAIDIISLVAPDVDTSLVTLIGMKKWPYKQNTYLAIVCVSRSSKDYSADTLFSDGKQCCNAGYGGTNESENPKIVYLSMIEYVDKLKLTAAYPGPLDIKTSWRYSNIESPEQDSTSNLNPGNYDCFDFANYKVSDSETAFGIRVGWRTMYSGGGGYFKALMLFIVQGDKIINILSEPTDEEGMSGGDWQEDGTRDKNFWETHNVVIMLPHKSSGFYDLRMKQIDSKWFRDFKWDMTKNRYIPKTKNN